jgi:3(or 17)beta-hydroxysteroid dehydrogenase
MNRVQNKIALITGAASGIGEAIAKLFHAEGAKVILTDINDAAGEKLAKQLGDNAEYIHLDVSKESDWLNVFNKIKNSYKFLDILVNNAGIGGMFQTKGPHDPENLDMESWHKVHAINSDGVAMGCKYGIQLMRERSSAAIVNISSRSGMVGIPWLTAYASSKASVRNHTKSVALYCTEKNYKIRCNSIHPGAILTPMWDPMLGDIKRRDAVISQVSSEIPLGHMGVADDVAYGALYLASDESAYVTGIELTIDGGILAGSAASPKQR